MHDHHEQLLQPEIEGYLIIQHLGSGGQGDVWLGYHQELKRLEAIKIMPVEFLLSPQLKEVFVGQLKQEGAILAKLNHPSIAAVHGVGLCKKGLPYLAMEYVPGVTLATHLQRRRVFDRDQVIHIIANLAQEPGL